MSDRIYEVGDARPAALVTGASAGLGEIFARQLAERGCDLILVARRRERLEALRARIESDHGVAAQVLVADLTRDRDVHRAAERIRRCGNLRYLVNNAGFGTVPLFAESDLASQDAMARVHVLAVAHLTHAALEGMLARGKGYIINVASMAAFFQSPTAIMYCATKA